MNYLIIFDRSNGQSEIKPYPDEELSAALRDQLAEELRMLRNGSKREIVILNAQNLDDLRETHARYFGDAALRAEVKRLIGDAPAA